MKRGKEMNKEKNRIKEIPLCDKCDKENNNMLIDHEGDWNCLLCLVTKAKQDYEHFTHEFEHEDNLNGISGTWYSYPLCPCCLTPSHWDSVNNNIIYSKHKGMSKRVYCTTEDCIRQMYIDEVGYSELVLEGESK